MTAVVCDNCGHTHEHTNAPITPHACEKCGHGTLTVQLPNGANTKLRVNTTSGEQVNPITHDVQPTSPTSPDTDEDDDQDPVVNPL